MVRDREDTNTGITSKSEGTRRKASRHVKKYIPSGFDIPESRMMVKGREDAYAVGGVESDSWRKASLYE
jgi:hypothetical protein